MCFNPPVTEGNSFNRTKDFNRGNKHVFKSSSCFKDCSNIKVVYTNADVLTKVKLLELNDIAVKEGPHVIAITEAYPKNKTNEIISDSYNIAEYDMFFTEDTTGRGIIIYVKKLLRASLQ